MGKGCCHHQLMDKFALGSTHDNTTINIIELIKKISH